MSKVGPVVENTELGRAVAEAIRRENPGAQVIDRGAYLRLVCQDNCVLELALLEEILGRALLLPEDLERVMPSFAGRLEIGPTRVRWYEDVP